MALQVVTREKMIELKEDDVIERLSEKDDLNPFMQEACSFLSIGVKHFLPSLFVNNDEEILEYAVKPLLAKSGPLNDINVSLRLIFALGKIDKYLYADILSFFQYSEYVSQHQKPTLFSDEITYDFIKNLNVVTENKMLFHSLNNMKYADFSVYSKARYGEMVKTVLTLAITSLLKELVCEDPTLDK